MLISYRKLTFFILTFTIGISMSINEREIILQDKYLLKSDLIVLLKSLEKIIKFSTVNTIDSNLNYVFGIFLISVNLERMLNVDDYELGYLLRQYMNKLLETNNRNLNVFMKNIDKFKIQDMKIFAGMNLNASLWASRIKRFKIHPRKRHAPIEKSNSISLRNYKNAMYNDEVGIPTPKMSDKCLASFYQSSKYYTKGLHQCKVDGICHYIIRDGTNIGYALTHRLLPLLIARLGRGCSIFSSEEDIRRAEQICMDIYKEAQIIAQNNFFIMDLLMEQIALCSLIGRAEFFHRSWFSEVFQFQTKDGCFSNYSTHSKIEKSDEKQLIFSDCLEHTTSVVAGALSAAIRFIIEKFY